MTERILALDVGNTHTVVGLFDGRELIARLMKNALPLGVPIEISLGVGRNWLEAH